jgi:hypothetical protein
MSSRYSYICLCIYAHVCIFVNICILMYECIWLEAQRLADYERAVGIYIFYAFLCIIIE